VVDDNETPLDPSDDLDVTANCAAIGGGSAQTVSLPTGDTVFHCSRTLAAGSHTNTVTVTASAGGFSTSDTASATVVVHANPDLSISTITCLDGVTLLTATDANDTGASFSWTKDGVAAGTGTTVGVTGTGSYQVTATSGNCTDTATRIVSFCSDTANNP
jgi:hypothetical protein